MQYKRNDIDFKPGAFRVRGDIVEINLVTGEKVLRVEFSAEKIAEGRGIEQFARRGELGCGAIATPRCGARATSASRRPLHLGHR